MPRFLRDNALTLVMFSLFLASLIGQSLVGHRYYNNTQREHGAGPVSLLDYLRSGGFVEAVFENWESEFLQMAIYVLLTGILVQRGASESKDPDQPDEDDPEAHRHDPNAPGPVRRGGWMLKLYEHSLSLALFGLFGVSWVLHAMGGAREECRDQRLHGQLCESTLSYMQSSRFWFESFQNWQSEFLSVGVLILLSVWLRERGSPQSKAVYESHRKTGAN